MINHAAWAGAAVILFLFFSIDNPTLLSSAGQAKLAAIELPSMTKRDDPMMAAQRRTEERVQLTYRRQCERWHKDCHMIKDLRQ